MKDDEPFYAGEAGRPSDLPVSIVPGGAGTKVPETPDWLGARGKEAWVRYWTVGRRWLSNEAHYDLILMICETVDDRESLRKSLGKVRDVVAKGSRGQDRISPIIRQIDATDAKLADLLKRGGFQPPEQRKQVGPKRQSRLDALRERKAGTDGG